MVKSNSHDIFNYLFIAVCSFLLGWFALDTKLLADEFYQDKKKHCIDSYKQMPVETLAGSFCDEFFVVLRGDKDE